MFNSRKVGCVAWAVIVAAIAATGWAPDFAKAAEPDQAIAWRDGQVKEAFVLALEENKRLVVAFLSPTAEKGRPNWSDRFSHELDCLELGRWADKAVFVRVRLVPQGEAGGDKEAQTMASKLKIDRFPHLAIIESRTDHLFESKRLPGFTPASEIPFFLNEGLAQANDLPVPDNAAVAIPAAPSTAPPAATPREALREYVEGTRTVDLPRLEKVLDARFAEACTQRLGAGDALYAAKQRLLRALDAQFGPRADEIPQGDDCEELYAEMRQLIGAKILSDRQEGQNVAMEVEFTLRRGGEITRKETILAIPSGDRWRLLPTAVLTAPEKRARHNEATRKYAESLEQLADEVLAGKWAVRVFAKEMAAKLYETAFAAGDPPPAATAPATSSTPGSNTAAAAPEKSKLRPPTEDELESMRALPAVYRIRTWGKYVVDFPQDFTIDLTALQASYDKDLAAGTIPETTSKRQYLWNKAAEDFSRCLKASGENRGRKTLVCTGHGSGVVVSREGFLLTNAHVVDEDKPWLEADEVQGIEERLDGALESLGKQLIAKLGGPPDERGKLILQRIYAWYGSQCRRSGKGSGIAVELAYTEPTPKLDAGEEAVSRAARLFGLAKEDARQPVLFPARVIAKGDKDKDDGAMDIAILHVEGARDRLITLPLAASGDVKKELPVVALGYPGYLDDLPKPVSEFYVVHLESGPIVSLPSNPLPRKRFGIDLGPPKFGLPLLQIGCSIAHGMSGGPVVNAHGEVVGLNVSGFRHRGFLFESKYAVPIWNAKKMLDEQGIKLEASPLTTTWEEGLTLYRAGDFAAAEAKFREIAGQQVGQLRVDTLDAEGKPVPVKPTDDRRPIVRHNIVSRYVQQMIALCAERQQK
jgi:S1-C subfamily serine protease